MVERDNGVTRSKSSELLAPEKRLLTNGNVEGMFGANYRKLIEDRTAQLGIRDLQFFDSPRPHDRSQAVYVAEEFVGDDLILVAVLEAGMATSRHRHVDPMKKEIYVHIAGKSLITIGAEIHELNDRQPRVDVPLDIFHQVRTQESPSLTLIIMKNAAFVKGLLHIIDE